MFKKIFLLLTIFLSSTAFADTVLITGANRGIGLEFVKQYADKGYTVIATARNPATADELNAIAKTNSKVIVEPLDVLDHAAIEKLAAKYHGQPIDILLSNAGISGGNEQQKLGNIDYEVYAKVMAVNVYGPMKLAEAFLPNIQASQQKKIIAVSSSMGSIKKTFGLLYIYRSSKSALNMAYATMAKELKRKKIIVGLVNPGPTDTDFMSGVKMKLRPPELAVTDMIRNIDNLTLKTTGAYLDYDGSTLPW
ncbi:SDR family oxidoreductase [Oceanicoccus sp. KOV_DT_Chl]|uniref:SDR family oxidoreductase n=1 Tax=Oceanicoccus sp. KOV_DT_Chl TaxID=1904639 RepID=UPI000C7A7120|nr:SDR family oxidoreductase [Oceanicoccus sp. KOV_DT_Chl]